MVLITPMHYPSTKLHFLKISDIFTKFFKSIGNRVIILSFIKKYTFGKNINSQNLFIL